MHKGFKIHGFKIVNSKQLFFRQASGDVLKEYLDESAYSKNASREFRRRQKKNK